MGNELFLISPMPPSVNHFTGIRTVMKNGRPLSIMYTTNEAKRYKSEFAKYVFEQVKAQEWSLQANKSQHFYIDAVFYFASIGQDPNNYFKCLLDAITDSHVIWADDNTTCERVQGIYYDSENPRVELTIHPVDYIGIFENRQALDSFESVCKKCSRYNRNCSILRKAKEGRIQREIADGTCAKYKENKGD